jgi:hypothetical protein
MGQRRDSAKAKHSRSMPNFKPPKNSSKLSNENQENFKWE